jgi:uncharacterized membrane protein YgdD (TMEM256/DUF423 family)
MLTFSRIATFVYASLVCVAGYIGVVTVHGLAHETHRVQRLASLSETNQSQLNHKLLVLDDIEPSAHD